MQEALKKSNRNVLELKETINELMAKEKSYKNCIMNLERENEKLKEKEMNTISNNSKHNSKQNSFFNDNTE
jgi:N-acetylmuramic acid 6-phosphate (MurNAc-6-P) etherase